MSSHTTNAYCSPEYHASLQSRFCPECGRPATIYPLSHTVRPSRSSPTMQTPSGSSSLTTVLPLASGPSTTSLPSTVQLPVGLGPAVNFQKGRHGGLHISSVINTVQPPQCTPQQQGRSKPRKPPPPMLLQLVHGQRGEPHTTPEKCTVVGPEILELSDYVLDSEVKRGPDAWKSFLWRKVVLQSGLFDRLKDRLGDPYLDLHWPCAVYFVASWGSKPGTLISLPSSAFDAGTLRNVLSHPRWFRKDLRTLVIEVDDTTPESDATLNVSRKVTEELARQELEERDSMELPENWDPSKVQVFYNADGADPDAPRITTRYNPPTPEPEFLSEGLLATLTSSSGTDTSPVVTASATSAPTTPPPATVQAHRTASGTTTKRSYALVSPITSDIPTVEQREPEGTAVSAIPSSHTGEQLSPLRKRRSSQRLGGL